MKMDYTELEIACREVAKATLWTGRELSADILATHAEKLASLCEDHIQYVRDMGRDPNLITRAVRYIAHTHAIPPMGTHIEWFEDMLRCLIELAVPNTGQTPTSIAFLHDVKEGIEESMQEDAA